MKHIVCYSGGHSSALVAIEVTRKFGKENVILLNHDINANVENDDIKRFKKEVADYLELPITYANIDDKELKDIPDQFDVIDKIGYFTDRRRNVLCTYKLKTEPFQNYLEKNFPSAPYNIREDVIIYYGFDLKESHRINRRAGIMAGMGYKIDAPLAVWKNRTIQSTEEIGIKPPLTYSQYKHANCVGCLKAGKQHWYVVYCTRPDVWEKAKALEDKIDYSIIKDSFLKDLEPKFKAMKEQQIEPTEHKIPQTFWAEVRKVFKDNGIETDEDLKPCECTI